MTAELDYVRSMHNNFRGLEALADLGSLPPDVVRDAAGRGAEVIGDACRTLEREPRAQRSQVPERTPEPQTPAGGTHDPDLLDFCYRRRGLQPGQEPTEQDVLVTTGSGPPKRVNPRLAAARSRGRERRALQRRERGA